MLKYSILTFPITLEIIAGTHSFQGNRNPLPLWTWECVNAKCVPSKPMDGGKLQSLITCNMLCGTMQLWPPPIGPVNLATAVVPVRADLFQLKILSSPSHAVKDHLHEAFNIMRSALQRQERPLRGDDIWRWNVIVRLVVNGSADPRMLIDTDESYQLSVKPEADEQNLSVDIYAKSFCGARHAFETLSQLVWMDPYEGSLLALESALVADKPRFPYRGLLLDTARNYFPTNELLRTVDVMAANKLNTFHWHISDSQSFPLKLASAPQLATYGACSAGAVYSTDDVQAVVKHARLRGVRVLLEVDVPAHAGRAWSWGPRAGLGHLLHCLEADPWSAYCGEPPCGQLNPRNRHVYTLLEKIYAEIIYLTGVDDLFHLGGDDVSERCWKRHFNETSFTELWLEFTRTALQHLETANQNRMPNLTLMWASHLSDNLKSDLKNYVPYIGLQTRATGWGQKVVSGFRTVYSNEDAWNFNDGLGAWYESGEGAPYNSWQRVYEHRPWARDAAGVAGGEGTVWSGRLGPALAARAALRAAALAGRLWADRAEGAALAVYARLDAQRARMLARGLPVSPVWSMWCTQNPHTCV